VPSRPLHSVTHAILGYECASSQVNRTVIPLFSLLTCNSSPFSHTSPQILYSTPEKLRENFQRTRLFDIKRTRSPHLAPVSTPQLRIPAHKQPAMSLALAGRGLRATMRLFSTKPPRPETRTERFVAVSCIISGVVLPFIPPALESSRERKYPTHQGHQYVPRYPNLARQKHTSNEFQIPSALLPRPINSGSHEIRLSPHLTVSVHVLSGVRTWVNASEYPKWLLVFADLFF
jgi:hypothetical protein